MYIKLGYANVTLPSGGRWAYFRQYASDGANIIDAGTISGGSVLSTNGYVHTGMAIRVA